MKNPRVGEKVYVNTRSFNGGDVHVGRHGTVYGLKEFTVIVLIDNVFVEMLYTDASRAQFNIFQSYCYVCGLSIFRVGYGQPWYHNDTDMMQSNDCTHFATTKHYGRDMNKDQVCDHCGETVSYDHSVDVYYHTNTGDRGCVGCSTYAAYKTSKALFLYSVVATAIALLTVAFLVYMATTSR